MVPLAYAAGLSLVGSISAMRQTKIKRLLALSGVANVGCFYCSSQWSMGSYSASFNRLCYIIYYVVQYIYNAII
jgi:NADH:ubiquinone oxidoreductase subunit 2 (subunit N)